MRNNDFRKLPHVLTPGQCGELCRAIDNLKLRAMVQLMYECALRLNEVCEIRVMHIDGQLKQIYVANSKGAKDRIVPITDRTLELLRIYWRRYRPGTGNDYLFRSESKFNHPYAKRTLQYVVAKAAVRAKLGRHVNCHLLRHSRATHWVNASVDIYHVSMMLGHKSVATTQIYLHTGIERLREVAQVADEKINQLALKVVHVAR